jgi:hypothetical protein
MNTNIKISYLLAVIGILFFHSCSNSTSVEEITSITISSDLEEVEVGKEISLTVVSNTNEDITDMSKIFVNDIEATGSKILFENAGAFKIHAKYNSLKSEDLAIVVGEPIVSYIMVKAPQAAYQAYTFTLEASAFYENGGISDITEEVEFYVNEESVSGHEISFVELGTLKIKAKYQDIESDVVEVEIKDPNILPQDFAQKSVVEDYTGTWCGWCPRVSHAISMLEEQTKNAFTVGVHIGDNMQNSYSTELNDFFNQRGFPTAIINRSGFWSYPEPDNIDQVLNKSTGRTNSGLEISTSTNGNVLDIEIRSGFTEDLNGVKLVVFILEDKIKAHQSNYTSYYGGTETLLGFTHNGVLKYSTTNVFGDDISSAIGIHSHSYEANLARLGIYNLEQVDILAMLLNENGYVINAQKANVNELQMFD